MHAAKSGIEAKRAVAEGRTADERMGLAGRAWRHLAAAGKWQHESACCPPQLQPEYRSKLLLLILLLTYHRTTAKAPDTRSEAACRLQVAMLHAIIEHCKAAALPRVGEWAARELEPLISHCWAVYHRDPRVRDGDDTQPDTGLAYAVCRLLSAPDLATVQHFIRDHGTVIGGNHTRDAEVRRTGALNLVRPLMATAELEERALPRGVLDGPAFLDGERPFATVVPVPATEDRNALALAGIGVALPVSALPRTPRASSWMPSFTRPNLPALPNMSFSRQPPPKPATITDSRQYL